jgi:4-amino-4-deoxy-L-arabinose transferase-like glycosyltransferase
VRRALLLVLLCVPSFFIFLGSAAITDSDEAYYAEASREMIESGDWITPRFNYDLRFEKPVLFYWMVAGAYTVTGVGEGAARFWAALSGIGLVLVAYACGRRWVNDDAGFVAGAVTATSYATAAMARQSLPDLPLAFFITLAIWSAFEAFSRVERGPTEWTARRWLILSAAACALAALTKGPVGVALPVLAVLPPIASEYVRAPAGRRRLPVSLLDLAVAVIVFLVIAVPWYAAVTWVHGESYLYRFFVGENIERFATPRYNDPRPIWFYLPILVGGLLPWSTFAVLWIRRVAMGSGKLLRLASWALVPLVVFSLSVGKQPRYILPCLVPLAILLGTSISARVGATLKGRRDAALTTAGLLSGSILLTVGVLLYHARPLLSAAGGRSTALWAIVVIAAAAAVIVVAVRRSARLLPATLAVAAATTLVALQGSIMTARGPEPVIAVAEVIVRERSAEADVCACGAFLRNLPFYVGARTIAAGTQDEVNAALASDRPIIAAIDERKLVEAETALGRRFERLFEAPYLNTALLRLDDFMRPDPDRTFQRVIVIRTR